MVALPPPRPGTAAGIVQSSPSDAAGPECADASGPPGAATFAMPFVSVSSARRRRLSKAASLNSAEPRQTLSSTRARRSWSVACVRSCTIWPAESPRSTIKVKSLMASRNSFEASSKEASRSARSRPRASSSAFRRKASASSSASRSFTRETSFSSSSRRSATCEDSSHTSWPPTSPHAPDASAFQRSPIEAVRSSVAAHASGLFFPAEGSCWICDTSKHGSLSKL
mmetsp:Transcript_13861/g.29012  ORF Transcript_13861/g.29012 Transcript_13861/m.29012 type:complete len:226 (+) Transcript_13861:855-1532(+)